MHNWLVRLDQVRGKGRHRVKGFDRLTACLDPSNAILPEIGRFPRFLPGLPTFRQNDFDLNFLIEHPPPIASIGFAIRTYEQNQTKA